MSTLVRPTIVDVARLAKVSVATVSNALNDRRSVDPETRKRVKAAAEQIGYTPNLRARRLRTGRADTIGIFSSMPFAIAGGRARMGFLMEIAASAAVRALESGIALILIPPLEHARPPLDDLQLDGAIVIAPVMEDPDVRLLQDRGVPVVSIGKQHGNSSVPYVEIHSHYAAKMMLEHLQSRSARRIALMIGSQARNAYLETERAYRDFAEERGMPQVVCRLDEAGGEQAGRAATLALFRDHSEIDAICVPVDAFAVGAAAAAQQIGRDIPKDVMLVTRYDGRLARECLPPLTALDMQLEELGSLGVELLLGRLRGENDKFSMPGPLPILVPRQSSART